MPEIKQDIRGATFVVAANDSLHKNMTDYVCNGVDDQEEILAAFNALPATGGEIMLLDGTFSLSRDLLLETKNDVTLRGQGSSTILKVIDGIASTLSSPAAGGQPDVVVVDTTGFIVGQDVFIGDPIGGIHIANYWGRTESGVGETRTIGSITPGTPGTLTMTANLTNAYIVGDAVWTIFDAIRIRSCDRFKLLNLTVDGNQANQTLCLSDIHQNVVRFSACEGIEVAGCYIREGVYNHIMTHPAASLRADIHDNYIETSAVADYQTRGITLESNSHDSVIQGNRIKGLSFGVYSIGSRILVIGNTLTDMVEYGISISADNCTIVGNIIASPGIRGIDLASCEGGEINGNYIIGCGRRSIYLATSNHIEIIGNTILLSEEPGMMLRGSTYCRIANNLIKDSGQAADNNFPGIWFYDIGGVFSQYNLIEHNTIVSTTANRMSVGIFEEPGCDNNVIRYNFIEGETQQALYLRGKNTVRGNIGYVTKIPVVQKIGPCAAAGAATVHALIPLAATEQNITAGITNPDVYRCLSITAQRTGGVAMTGDVVITGTDWLGSIITETIAITDSGITLGVKPFMTVININVPAWTNDANDQIAVGWCDKLGLYRDIDVAGDFLEQARKAAAATVYTIEAVGAVDATNETVNIATTGAIVLNDWLELSYNAEDL